MALVGEIFLTMYNISIARIVLTFDFVTISQEFLKEARWLAVICSTYSAISQLEEINIHCM